MTRFYIFLFLFSFSTSYSQTEIITSPMLVSTAGDNWIQGEYNLCFSIGEIAIETHMQNNTILTQGFHQEDIHETTVIDDIGRYQVAMYPNPTTNNISINCNIDQEIDITIRDIKGKEVCFFSNINGNKTKTIDLSSLKQGVYLIEFLIGLNERQIYKIQKIN